MSGPGPDALAELAARAAAGDDTAFEALMVATQRRVAAVALRLLGSREDARDATQEVFLRIHRYLGSYRPGGDFHGWIYRIAVNVCRDAVARRRPELPLDAHAAQLAGTDDVEAGAARAQQALRVREALASLPPKERFAVVLRDLEGRPTEEVARLLGSSPTTVRSQISSARKRLRALFSGAQRRET